MNGNDQLMSDLHRVLRLVAAQLMNGPEVVVAGVDEVEQKVQVKKVGSGEVTNRAGENQRPGRSGDRTEPEEAQSLGRAGAQGTPGGAVPGCNDQEVRRRGGGWGSDGVWEVSLQVVATGARRLAEFQKMIDHRSVS